MRVRLRVHVHMCMYVCVYVRVCARVCVYVRMCVCVNHTCDMTESRHIVGVFSSVVGGRVCVYVYVCVCARALTRLYVRVHVFLCM